MSWWHLSISARSRAMSRHFRKKKPVQMMPTKNMKWMDFATIIVLVKIWEESHFPEWITFANHATWTEKILDKEPLQWRKHKIPLCHITKHYKRNGCMQACTSVGLSSFQSVCTYGTQLSILSKKIQLFLHYMYIIRNGRRYLPIHVSAY